MHIGYNLRSFEFPRLLSQLQGLIPKEGLSQHETEFYQFLHEFLPERSESWAEVVEFLLCIFQNRDKWDMEATFTWDEEGEDTFEYTAKEITELVEEDFQSSPYRDIDVNLSEISVLHRNIAASKQPELWSTEKKWRDLLSDAIRDIREDYLRNPVGYSNEETVLGTTIFGHMLGRETVRKIGDEPQYFNDSTFRWARSKRQGSKDLMELWVTATCAGQVTAPHEDGPGPEAMIFHIFGIKLWVIWDGNEENQQTLSNHRTPWRIDIKWAMKNLRGAKLYFLWSNPGGETRRRLVLPGGAVHAVISFTSCMALSANFFRRSQINHAKERIQIFERSLYGKKWPVNEMEMAKERLSRSRVDLDSYISFLEE